MINRLMIDNINMMYKEKDDTYEPLAKVLFVTLSLSKGAVSS